MGRKYIDLNEKNRLLIDIFLSAAIAHASRYLQEICLFRRKKVRNLSNICIGFIWYIFQLSIREMDRDMGLDGTSI